MLFITPLRTYKTFLKHGSVWNPIKKVIFSTKTGYAIVTSRRTLFWYCLEPFFLRVFKSITCVRQHQMKCLSTHQYTVLSVSSIVHRQPFKQTNPNFPAVRSLSRFSVTSTALNWVNSLCLATQYTGSPSLKCVNCCAFETCKRWQWRDKMHCMNIHRDRCHSRSLLMHC